MEIPNQLLSCDISAKCAFTTFDLFIFSLRKLLHGKDVGTEYKDRFDKT